MKIQVKMCKCNCCKAGWKERRSLRKYYNKAFRKRTKMFIKGHYKRDPIDFLTVPRYTD